MESKEIRDAVHEDIDFDSFELDVINTPQFQRMRGIRQLGLAHLVYPCAQHTRFEHSLGVAHMTDRIIQAITKNKGHFTDNERRFVRALALIHDIGHIPFGHTLEDERPVFGKEHHHDCAARLAMFLKGTKLEQALNALGSDIGHPELVDDLIRVMKKTHEESEGEGIALTPREQLYAAIVGNTICADLLDYLKRDPYFTGIQHRYDGRIISAFKIDGDQIYLDLDDQGHLRRSVLSEILHLLRLRYTLGERVYYYPTKSSGSAMISKAVELSGLSHSALAPLRDEELLYIFENASTIRRVAGEPIENVDLVRRLVEKIRTRNLYVPAYTISLERAGHQRDELVRLYHEYSNISIRRKAEEKLAECVGATPDQIIIYCPNKSMASKAAMVNVRWPKEARLRPLQELCEQEVGIDDATIREEIRQLKLKHLALWQMTLFIDPALRARQRDLSAHSQAMFFSIPNCNPACADSPLQAVLERRVLDAVLLDPQPETIDRAACRQMLNSNENSNWPTELVLPRVSPVMRVEKREMAKTPTFSQWFKGIRSGLPVGETRSQLDKAKPRLKSRLQELSPDEHAKFSAQFELSLANQSSNIFANELKGGNGDEIVRVADQILQELNIAPKSLLDNVDGSS